MATLAQVRSQALQLADFDHDNDLPEADRFVTNEYVDALINRGYKALYSILTRHGFHRAETDISITADGSLDYGLPSNFWAMLTVHGVNDDGSTYLLQRHDVRHRPDSSYNAPAYTYRVVGIRIELSPVPSSGEYVACYIPVPDDLVDDTDTLDGVLGWEEYVITWVAIRLLRKEGSETADLQQELAALERRIADEANAEELTEGARIQNVRDDGCRLPGDYPTYARPRGWWGI